MENVDDGDDDDDDDELMTRVDAGCGWGKSQVAMGLQLLEVKRARNEKIWQSDM